MRRAVLLLLTIVAIAAVLSFGCRSSAPMRALDTTPGILGSQPSQPVKPRPPAGKSVDGGVDSALAGPLEPTRTEHFEVFHEPGASYTALAGRTLEYAYQHFYQVFARAGFDLLRPQDRLVWICFPQKSGFNRYALQVEGMDLSWLDGYYSTLTNRVSIVQPDEQGQRREERPSPNGGEPQVVAANRSPREGVLPMSAAEPWLDVTRLTHEVAHQLAFNSGIQKRGVLYPLWISEGLATNFEFSGGVDPGLDHTNTPRLKGLLEAYAAGELSPLSQFVVQTTVPPDLNMGRRYYAQAWGFFHFVLTERPASLRVYLQRLARNRPGHRDANTMRSEFVDSFGPLGALESSWNAFLARQAGQVSADSPTFR